MMDYSSKLQKCHGYLNALEEERRKIEMFQRELPLCLDLVTRAIEGCKQQISDTNNTTDCVNGQSECSEQTTSDGPVFEEFMPIKRSYSSEQPKEEEDGENSELESHTKPIAKKSDWLRSVQLWNQTPDPPNTNQEDQINRPMKLAGVNLKRKHGGAFQPFKKEKSSPATVGPSPAPAASACSSGEEGGGGKGGEGQPRKSRRCWSPELHRRFLNALQQLGGSHVATPKQIKEQMNVDGLTNDEVKSHLQKYRLHTRRPASAVHHTNTQAPQFVVVRGIWVPPPEYVAPASSIAAAQLVSTAPAGLPRHQEIGRKKLSSGSLSQRGDGGRCNSSSTSSSTHTTTASHA